MMTMMKLPLLCLSILCGIGHAQDLVCTFADPITLDDEGDVTLEQVANVQEGTFTMRLTYYGGQSWIGIGINKEDSNNMSPSTAVIGSMVADGEFSVLKYDLESDAKDGSGVIPMSTELQTLQDVSFTQTESTSVLEFTQFLNEETQTVTEESVWIWAVGLPNNQWTGKHNLNGAFYIRLDENCVQATTDPPTQPPAAGGSETEVDNGGDTTQEETGDGSSENDTQDQDPSGATDSDSQSGIIQIQATTDETRSLWVAHGVLMALAWGVCAPLAIGSVLLRHVAFLASNGRWYKIHFYLNVANVLFTFIGFFLAVAAMQKEGEEHFTENTHTKAGLAIFFIVLFQFALAFMRPDPPKAPAVKDLEQDSTFVDTEHSSTGNASPRHSIEGVEHAVTVDVNGFEVAEDSASDESSEKGEFVKSKPRLAWEISHRFIGMVLLGLAWYNCTSGIQLQVEKYDENDDKMAAFWGVTAGISGLIFFLAYIVRV